VKAGRAIGVWQRFDRPRDGRLLGGVCSAIAERLVLHVWLVRIAFAVLALADGIGIALYLLAWLLLPVEGERYPVQTRLRDVAAGRLATFGTEVMGIGRSLRTGWAHTGRPTWPRPPSRRWIGIGLIGLGAVVLLASFGAFGWLTPIRAVGLVAVVAGIAALSTLYGGRR